MNVRSRKKIVVLGMMAKLPVAGVVWQTMHYLVGFERLGYDVYYVEAHATTPTMFLDSIDHDGSAKFATFLDRVLRRFDLGDRWAFHALHSDRRSYVKGVRSHVIGVSTLKGSDLTLRHEARERRIISKCETFR